MAEGTVQSMTEKSRSFIDLPDLEADVKRLEDQISSALRDTTVDWSQVPLWKILADNPENPYGLSKIGLRRYQRALERKLKRIERERAKERKRIALERSRRAKESRLRYKRTHRSTPKGILARLRLRASQEGIPFDLSLEFIEQLVEQLGDSRWSVHLVDKSLGFTVGNITVKLGG